MAKSGKKNDALRAGNLVAGTHKQYPNGNQLLAFGGGNYTVTEVTTRLQSVADLRTATEEAQATAASKVADEKAKLPSLLAFTAAYVAFVKATLGNTPDALAAFGLAARKARVPLTAQQVAAKVAKVESTRKARGTMGPRKKLAVKGDVTGVVVTPVTTPPSHQT